MNTEKKIGVLLLNLGGPEKLEDVRPFLYNLFSDRQIIRLGPFFLQKPLAALIAKKRAPKSAKNYAQIGGGSPLGRITAQQAAALEEQLKGEGDFLVRSCMRYWYPFAQDVLKELVEQHVQELVALPLYPHYSIATSGSSFTDLKKAIQKLRLDIPLKTIESWPAQEQYVSSLVTKIQDGIKQFGDQEVTLLYSAHSLPKAFIEEGDPYVDELKLTIAAVEKQTAIKGHLCYQSRSGPVEWLGPSTPETIETCATRGCKNMLVVPLSFVSDHVETLYELDIEYRQLAEEKGLNYKVTGGLNADPVFIEGLRQLVLEQCG
ncbi:MAG: ferrochelatase [Desulfobacterales bacterium]|nr:MAG: ferrochelatase [Desulfobacterales bacterium]